MRSPGELAASPLLRPALHRAGQSGHGAMRRERRARPRRSRGRRRLLPRSRRSTSWWSGPRRPSSPASPTILRAAGIQAFGPTQAAAQLEGSKGFTKDLCAALGIPTAAYRALHATPTRRRPMSRERGRADRGQGRRARRRQGRRRGASVEEAEAALDAMFGGALGDAGAEVVIEEFLTARRRASSPSATARPRSRSARRRTTSASSTATGAQYRRHGRLFARPGPDRRLEARVMGEIVGPTLAGMRRRGTPFAACSTPG